MMRTSSSSGSTLFYFLRFPVDLRQRADGFIGMNRKLETEKSQKEALNRISICPADD
jgi:hypothetical protein